MVVAVISLLLTAGVVGVVLSGGQRPPSQAARPPSTTNSPPAQANSPAAQPGMTAHPGTTAREADPVAADIERLRTVSWVAPPTREARIAGDVAQQPDLYAAEFVRRLLTQDYRRPRAEHLAWVQAESAQTSEPLVVGLVPKELRSRLAVYSVTEAAGQTPAVPGTREWVAFGIQHAYTTVHIEHVEEPMAWSTAVSSGRISDPGVTGREVSATVTHHYLKAGRATSSTSSVAMTLNLEGPPSRESWGFVTAVTYSSLPVSAS
ncbi:hypothetical protein [Terrabacter sp. C0L_2]|uniref:hypothetical protein n=1 Tax=Terrabacter sp. C0L_2 TaxID=3108389 RepID=UPI002ED45C0C|nr:hypothetical protein U5C87_00010 [Terrabacter sp. C0L_2]